MKGLCLGVKHNVPIGKSSKEEDVLVLKTKLYPMEVPSYPRHKKEKSL